MRRAGILAMLLTILVHGYTQPPAIVDSFKRKLVTAKTREERFEMLSSLSQILMNSNIAEADSYAKQMTETAEDSRDRSLMVRALLVNGRRYAFLPSNREFMQKSIGYYQQAYDLAKANKLNEDVTKALICLASDHLVLSDHDRALNFANQAMTSISGSNDSLRMAVYNVYGSVFRQRKEQILALRNYLNALRIAEKSKRPELLRDCYINLREFYDGINAYDKAIDFAHKAMDQLDAVKTSGVKFSKVVDLFYIGNLYMGKKDFDMSQFYFEKSIALADSLKYQPLKTVGYNGLLNQYLVSHQPEKALKYFNNSPELKSFILNYGMSHIIDQAYAVIYTELGKFDSARYYYEKAAPAFERSSTMANRLSFYNQYAKFYKKSGDKVQAIAMFQKADSLADQTGNIEFRKLIAAQMDTLYASSGDYKQSYFYRGRYQEFKDSLETLGKEKELLQLELSDENERQKLIEQEEAEALTRKHNVQYMAITIGIAVAFLILIVLGIFQVSVATIKIMGFFAFIFLFEFIILIADGVIHHWTHGEPLPILGIKIILIAMLLPLHHWLEHKVVGYLASKHMIVPRARRAWVRILSKRSELKH